jgi:hypothetical protein
MARLAETGEPLLSPGQQLRRVCAGAESRDEEEGCGLFALNEDRPLFAFAGIWYQLQTDPRPHQVYV